jgi:hypothetical protein
MLMSFSLVVYSLFLLEKFELLLLCSSALVAGGALVLATSL